jgi:hypothetical protein
MASPVAGTSLGRTVYQELLEFTWFDLAQGDSHMAFQAREAWKAYGIAKDKETHYCRIRLVGLPTRGGVLCTFDLLPYGESVFKETISIYSEESANTTLDILGTIGMVFGVDYIDKLFPCIAKRITKWVKSTERIIGK